MRTKMLLTVGAVVVPLMLSACGDDGGPSVMRDLKSIAGEMIKSSSQQQAEDACRRTAANVEAQRFKNFRAITRRIPETTDLGGGHYIIRVGYRVITLEHPEGEEGNNLCMFQRTTCEVQGNKIVNVVPRDIPSFCR